MSLASAKKTVGHAGLALAAEALGEASAPTVLLLAGNGCSAVYWPDAFCSELVAEGLRVIRYDYRDTGASTHRAFVAEPYDLEDLAGDAWAIADAFGAREVHLVGLSPGGFLAQRMTLAEPGRVRTLTSLLSTSDYATMLHAFSGAPAPTSNLPPPSSEWLAALGRLSPDLSLHELLLESWRLASGLRGSFDRAYWDELLTRAAAAGADAPAGEYHRQASLRSARHNLLSELAACDVPALFIGGSEDPIFPVGHAEASAEAARNGRAVMIDGLGHALSPEFFGRIAGEIGAHIRSGGVRL